MLAFQNTVWETKQLVLAKFMILICKFLIVLEESTLGTKSPKTLFYVFFVIQRAVINHTLCRDSQHTPTNSEIRAFPPTFQNIKINCLDGYKCPFNSTLGF